MICPAQPSLSGEVIIIDEEDDDCESIGHTPGNIFGLTSFRHQSPLTQTSEFHLLTKHIESQPDRYSDLTQVIRRASLETVLSLPQAQYPDTHLRIAHSLTSRGESPEPIFRPETTRRAKDKMSSDRTRVNSGNAPKRKRSPKASPSPSIFELDSHSTVNGRRSDWSPDTLSGNESDNELAEEVENLYLVPLDDASPDTDGSSHHKFLAGDFLSDAAIEDRFSRGSQTNSSQERGAPKKYRRRNPTFIPVRNVPVGPEVQAILLCSYNDINLSPGTTVELIDGTFVRLQRILRNRVTGVVNLRGWIFRRNSDDQTPLAPVLNEVYWVNDIDRDDPRPFRRQCVEEFSVGQVVRARKLIITNNADVNSENQSTGTMVNDDMTLICRVRALRIWKTAKERMGDKYCERAFVYVMSSEADAGPDAGPLRFRLRDDVVRSKFRGETILGGSAIGMSVAEKERRDYEDRKREEARTQRIDLEEEDTITLDRDGISSPSPDDDDDYSESEDVVEIHQIETMPARAHHSNNADPLWRATARAAMPKSSFNPQHQNYSYADAFAGAGGTTRGAVAAGARVRWALDFNEEACRSYAKSFPWVRIANCDAYHFVTNDLAYEPRYVRVDILHLSPPCQVFSPAHTTEGINDAANYAASLSIWWFLRKVKPRIATLENTFGLQQRHPVWLRAILNQFTSEGYSVRYMILHFKDYGLPTIRKRLIIIAAW